MLGEMGPGDNIGLIASKSCGTGIRGKYYAIAAAMGKIGAFIGNYIFPYLIDAGGGDETVTGGQYPFYLASALCFVSACLVWLLPRIDQVRQILSFPGVPSADANAHSNRTPLRKKTVSSERIY